MEVVTLGNESLITRARNNLLSTYYHNYPDYNYMLFLDADMWVEPEGIVRMINSGLDVICAPYRTKNLEKFTIVVTRVIDDSNFPIVEVEHAGTGCMLLSRKVVEDVVKYAINMGLYYPDPMAYSYNSVDKPGQRRYIYDVFQVGIDKRYNTYLSEDYFFCNLVRSLGYKVYVDLSVKTIHCGNLSLPYDISMLARPTQEVRKDAGQAETEQQGRNSDAEQAG